MNRFTEGDWAWVGLVVYVALYDMIALKEGRETLSGSFARAMEHPIRRWPTLAAWGILTGHLFRVVPARWDPMRFDR